MEIACATLAGLVLFFFREIMSCKELVGGYYPYLYFLISDFILLIHGDNCSFILFEETYGFN